MTLFDILDADPDALAKVGRRVREAVRAVGVPLYYRHPDLGYVREHPDGTLEPVEPGSSRHEEPVIV